MPTDTEVLSVDGFKKYNELKEGDLIYSWKDGGLIVNPVRKVIVKPFSGNLHSYRGRNYNQTVTPNHRMLVKKHNIDEYMIKRSEEIFDVETPYPLPTQLMTSIVEDFPVSDEEIMLAAMVYTDGCVEMRGESVHKICIFKSPKRQGVSEIQDICEKLNLKYSLCDVKGEFGTMKKFAFYGENARQILALIGQKKKIDTKFLYLSMRQARLFLDTWAIFDGDEDKKLLQFDNETIRDQLQQIAILAGYTSYIRTRNKTNYVKIRQCENIYPHSREQVEYDGLVWCPNVEAGTAIFRKDGNVFISGQTQAPFSNVTLDWVVPDDMKNMPAIIGGKEMDFTYGDCKAEMDMVNKAFLEIMIEGDADGRGFQYPMDFVA